MDTERPGSDPEHLGRDLENFEKGEWVEVSGDSPISLAKRVEDEMENDLKAKGLNIISPAVPQRAANAIERSFNSIYKNGIKNKNIFNTMSGFRFRFVDLPPEMSKKEDLIAAASYEIEIPLSPRYAKDGESGNYALRFTTHARHLTQKELEQRRDYSLAKWRGQTLNRESMAFVRTTPDSMLKEKTRQLVKEQAAQARIISQTNWANSVRNSLRKVIYTGLPGLGKK